MTREVGRNRGRPLLLSVRVLPRPEQALDIGLDPISWAGDGSIDIVSAGHFLGPTSLVDIPDYRDALPATVPLHGSIDRHGTDVSTRTAEHRRMARQFRKDKADGVLVFNFFTHREQGREPDWAVLEELGTPIRFRPTTSDMQIGTSTLPNGGSRSHIGPGPLDSPGSSASPARTESNPESLQWISSGSC
jgi:hypothetical protein